MRSPTFQRQILQEFGLQIHAESGFRRNQAERGVKEFKLRMSIFLQTRGRCAIHRSPLPQH